MYQSGRDSGVGADYLTEIKGEGASLRRTVMDFGREVQVVAKRLSGLVLGGCEEGGHPQRQGSRAQTKEEELVTFSKRRGGQFAQVDTDAKVDADTRRRELWPVQGSAAIGVKSVTCEQVEFSLCVPDQPRTSPGELLPLIASNKLPLSTSPRFPRSPSPSPCANQPA